MVACEFLTFGIIVENTVVSAGVGVGVPERGRTAAERRELQFHLRHSLLHLSSQSFNEPAEIIRRGSASQSHAYIFFKQWFVRVILTNRGYHFSHLCNWDLKCDQFYYIFITEVTATVKLILFLTTQNN